jgi:predicted aconitase with swiveling domain
MINIKTHPVFAYASIVLDIPTVDGLDKDPLKIIETGDWVKVDAKKGIVEVTKKSGRR